jgi:hypothetical protein
MVKADVEKAIWSAVKDRFPGREIESIRVREDLDHDGDPILRVDLIVRERKKVLDPKRTGSLTGLIRARLSEIGITSFPVLSFISKSEAGKIGSVAA